MISKSIIVKGKVQGVFFRASAKRIAESLNLNGWVKNNDNGDVEILVTGDQTDIEKFIIWSKTGPEKAKVREVLVSESNEIPLHNFKIIN